MKKEYTYCTVVLNDSASKTEYWYLTDDKTIEAGDSVIVPVGNTIRMKPGIVTSVAEYSASDVPHPVADTKSIIRKCDIDDIYPSTPDTIDELYPDDDFEDDFDDEEIEEDVEPATITLEITVDDSSEVDESESDTDDQEDNDKFLEDYILASYLGGNLDI